MRWVVVWIGLCISGVSGMSAEHPGEVLYRQQCAECHGPMGEGVAGEYESALYGDLSLEALAGRIDRTMPEYDPEACTGEDARRVAEWIFDAFYSPDARERLGMGTAARVDLARLTVAQHRNALADLLLSFDPGAGTPDEGAVEFGGLRGRYYSSDGMNLKKELGLERTDGRLDFEFGEEAPDPSINAQQFSITWEGSFLAEDTGVYRFRIFTPNGARLYINAVQSHVGSSGRQDSSGGSRLPLIDDWVSSGAEVRESEATVFLLGGRRYPIRFDYFKYMEARGMIRLEWKPPHGAWSPMPASVLSAAPAPRVFVTSAPFPPDDRSLGYERGAAVSDAWQRAVVQAAIETADEVMDRIDAFSRSDAEDLPRAQRLQAFCRRFAEAALRRPLDEEEQSRFVDQWFAGELPPDTAARRSILLCLSSPPFLYTELPEADAAPDAWTLASRLSFALWDSIPDTALLDAARSGRLVEPDAIVQEAGRMLDNPRTWAKLREFFTHWLEIEDRDLSKDRAQFPDFDDRVIADLRESLMRFIRETVWSEPSDYRELLLADTLLFNESLAALYGGEKLEGDGEFARYASHREHRAGVLTHPYLLSVFAYHDNTSPIHRGVFLTRNVIGRPLKPPPVAVAFENEEFDPDLTMREKVTHLTRDTACMACHEVINPLGFSLEHFDAVGRWRQTEQDKPIDARGEYVTPAGEAIPLSGARDVATFAAASAAAHKAFLKALFHHTVKQPPGAFGAEAPDWLRERFVEQDFNIREVLLEIVRLHASRGLYPIVQPGEDT